MQHLPEVVVAVMAHLEACDLRAPEPPDALDERVARCQHAARQLAERRGETIGACGQHLQAVPPCRRAPRRPIARRPPRRTARGRTRDRRSAATARRAAAPCAGRASSSARAGRPRAGVCRPCFSGLRAGARAARPPVSSRLPGCGTNACSISSALVAPSALRYSRPPSSGTQCSKPALVRKRPISSSGLMPSRTRRYALRKRRSPSSTAVLLLRPSVRAGIDAGSAAAAAAKAPVE